MVKVWDPKFESAVEYFERTKYDIPNGPDHQTIITFVKNMVKEDCTVEVQLDPPYDDLPFEDEYNYMDDLVVFLPRSGISGEILILINKLNPLEIEADHDILRLMW